VKRDLSDLVEKAKWCIENYDKAKQIAENAYEFSKKYLTRDACYEQWNKIITNS
jgi:spore maturation protein CgeB